MVNGPKKTEMGFPSNCSLARAFDTWIAPTPRTEVEIINDFLPMLGEHRKESSPFSERGKMGMVQKIGITRNLTDTSLGSLTPIAVSTEERREPQMGTYSYGEWLKPVTTLEKWRSLM